MAEVGPEAGVDRQKAEAWLEPRLEDAPPRLAEAVRRCLAEADPEPPPGSVPGWLAHAALGGLKRVDAERTGDRGQALRLLAADASLTFAFEAAAERGEDLDRLALEWGPAGRLGRELADRGRERP